MFYSSKNKVYIALLKLFSQMTTQEVYTELKKEVKPYIGIMEQGTFSNYMIRLNAGLLKPATINSFFNRMGYLKDGESWVKKKL